MLYKDQTLATERVYSTKIILGNDRVIKLKVKDGTKPISSTGMTDQRLFSGENKLHALRDEDTSLWYMKYEVGVLPPVLNQRFTSFSRLFNFAQDYFIKRNIEIEEDYGKHEESSFSGTPVGATEGTATSE